MVWGRDCPKLSQICPTTGVILGTLERIFSVDSGLRGASAPINSIGPLMRTLGESQQVAHGRLVAPGEPVGGHLVLVTTTKAAGAKEGGVRGQLL